MSKDPKTPKRPRDMNQLAKRIVEIATGEREEDEPEKVDPAARKRGKARAKALTAEERSAIARKAARARWSQQK